MKYHVVTSDLPTGARSLANRGRAGAPEVEACADKSGLRRLKNLDVLGTSRGHGTGFNQGNAAQSIRAPLLCGLGAPAAQPDTRHTQRKQYRCGGAAYITVPQATNIMEAVQFARSVRLPLVAHLTIYWAVTEAGDDSGGRRFARVREGLDKWLKRRGIEFAGAWARECPSGDAEHGHLLFHLPMAYRRGLKLDQLKAAVYRLVDRHGGGVWGDGAIKLVIWPNPDGKYLIKGGCPEVWKRFRLRTEHRRLQGTIHGKRCGTTENIGACARGQQLAAVSQGEGASC